MYEHVVKYLLILLLYCSTASTAQHKIDICPAYKYRLVLVQLRTRERHVFSFDLKLFLSVPLLRIWYMHAASELLSCVPGI